MTDAEPVLRALRERGQTLAVAESLTGGLLAATIVDVPGASDVFRGGLIVYATDLKVALAGVPPALLAAHGPVHADVAAALAAGARERCAADWGLATTGVAGPNPQSGVPVGTVFLGLAGPAGAKRAAGPASGLPGAAGPHGQAEVRRLALTGDRAEIRTATVAAALALLRSALAD
jgi:nicotinamide-nucleotide amidase